MRAKEVQQDLAKTMRQWQDIERKSMASTGAVIDKTRNPLIHLVMEIIQRDSSLHHRVQQMLIDSVEGKPLAVSPEEMAEVSRMLNAHLRLEHEMVGNVEATLEKVRTKRMVVAEYLLRFLMEDEKKHENLLSSLEHVKRGMFPT